jgi:hypothetical protein
MTLAPLNLALEAQRRRRLTVDRVHERALDRIEGQALGTAALQAQAYAAVPDALRVTHPVGVLAGRETIVVDADRHAALTQLLTRTMLALARERSVWQRARAAVDAEIARLDAAVETAAASMPALHGTEAGR